MQEPPASCVQELSLGRVVDADLSGACALTLPRLLFDPPFKLSQPASCAVVSSGGDLNRSRCGDAIARYDLVVRMNFAPTAVCAR